MENGGVTGNVTAFLGSLGFTRCSIPGSVDIGVQ